MTTSNSTDRKVTIKRRADGVYDIYVNDEHTGYRGSISSAIEWVGQLLLEE